jgi:hypothetical protein
LTCRSREAQPASAGAEAVGVPGGGEGEAAAGAEVAAVADVGAASVEAGGAGTLVAVTGDAVQPATPAPRQASPSQRTIIKEPTPQASG